MAFNLSRLFGRGVTTPPNGNAGADAGAPRLQPDHETPAIGHQSQEGFMGWNEEDVRGGTHDSTYLGDTATHEIGHRAPDGARPWFDDFGEAQQNVEGDASTLERTRPAADGLVLDRHAAVGANQWHDAFPLPGDEGAAYYTMTDGTTAERHDAGASDRSSAGGHNLDLHGVRPLDSAGSGSFDQAHGEPLAVSGNYAGESGGLNEAREAAPFDRGYLGPEAAHAVPAPDTTEAVQDVFVTERQSAGSGFEAHLEQPNGGLSTTDESPVFGEAHAVTEYGTTDVGGGGPVFGIAKWDGPEFDTDRNGIIASIDFPRGDAEKSSTMPFVEQGPVHTGGPGTEPPGDAVTEYGLTDRHAGGPGVAGPDAVKWEGPDHDVVGAPNGNAGVDAPVAPPEHQAISILPYMEGSNVVDGQPGMELSVDGGLEVSSLDSDADAPSTLLGDQHFVGVGDSLTAGVIADDAGHFDPAHHGLTDAHHGHDAGFEHHGVDLDI